MRAAIFRVRRELRRLKNCLNLGRRLRLNLVLRGGFEAELVEGERLRGVFGLEIGGGWGRGMLCRIGR